MLFYAILITVIILYTELHLIVYRSMCLNYNRVTRLNALVSSRHQNYCKILYYSSKLILQTLYTVLLQKLNSNVVYCGNNKYILTYSINGKLYKMVIKPRRGPVPVLQIRNELDQDLTDQLLPYLGPTYNSNDIFQQGFSTLTFELSSGKTETLTNSLEKSEFL